MSLLLSYGPEPTGALAARPAARATVGADLYFSPALRTQGKSAAAATADMTWVVSLHAVSSQSMGLVTQVTDGNSGWPRSLGNQGIYDPYVYMQDTFDSAVAGGAYTSESGAYVTYNTSLVTVTASTFPGDSAGHTLSTTSIGSIPTLSADLVGYTPNSELFGYIDSDFGLNPTTAPIYPGSLVFNPWVFEYWVKFSSVPSVSYSRSLPTIVASTASGPVITGYVINTGNGVSPNSYTLVGGFNSAGPFLAGWHHIAIKFDPISGNLGYFLDGVNFELLAATSTGSTLWTGAYGGTLTFKLLAHNTGYTDTLPAEFKDMRFTMAERYGAVGANFTPPGLMSAVNVLPAFPAFTQVATVQDTFAASLFAVADQILPMFGTVYTMSTLSALSAVQNTTLDAITQVATSLRNGPVSLGQNIDMGQPSSVGGFTVSATLFRNSAFVVTPATVPVRHLMSPGETPYVVQKLLQRFNSSSFTADYPAGLAQMGSTANYLSNMGRFKNGSFGLAPSGGVPGNAQYWAQINPSTGTIWNETYELSFWFYQDSLNDTFAIGLDTQGYVAGGSYNAASIAVVSNPSLSGRLLVWAQGAPINSFTDGTITDARYSPLAGTMFPAPRGVIGRDPSASAGPDMGVSVNTFLLGQWNHVVITQINGRGINSQMWLNGVRDLTFIADDLYCGPDPYRYPYNTIPIDYGTSTQANIVKTSVTSDGYGYVALDEIHVTAIGDGTIARIDGASHNEQQLGIYGTRGAYFPDELLPHDRYLQNIWVPDRPEQITPWTQLLQPFAQSAAVTNTAAATTLAAALAANATLAAAFTHTVPLTAAASASASTASALTLVGQLASAATAASLATSALTTVSAGADLLSAAAVAQATVTSALTHAVSLASVSAASSAVTALLTGAAPLASTATSAATATTALAGATPLVTAAAAGALSGAALASAVPLAAPAAAAATSSAALTTAAGAVDLLASTAVSGAAATASLANAPKLAAAGQGGSTASSALAGSTQLNTVALSAATASASVGYGQNVACAAVASASAGGSLFIAKALSDAASASASVAATIAVGYALAAAARAAASASGILSSKFVHSPDRTASVAFDPRTAAVAAELRALAVAAEVRGLVIPADTRLVAPG